MGSSRAREGPWAKYIVFEEVLAQSPVDTKGPGEFETKDAP